MGFLGKEHGLVNGVERALLKHAVGYIKAPQNLRHILGQVPQRRLFPILIDTVVTLGDTACNGRQGVAVAAKRDSSTDNILEALPFQKGDDGLGNSLLATLHMMIVGSNLIAGAVQVVAELRLNVLLNITPSHTPSARGK